MAAYPMAGEDAQGWVSRSRRENDEYWEVCSRCSKGYEMPSDKYARCKCPSSIPAVFTSLTILL